MVTPIKYKCIRLTQLCKLLDMFTKKKGHEGDKILIMFDDCIASPYNTFKDKSERIMIEDVAFNDSDKTLIIYCNTENNPDVEEVGFDGDYFIAYKFFCAFYYAFDLRRNVFTPQIIVRSDDGTRLYDGNTFYYLDHCLDSISEIYVLKGINPTVTCTFMLTLKGVE